MHSDFVVVITKDRPMVLSKTLDALMATSNNSVIIDDSTLTETFNVVRKRYNRDNVIYHGRSEQNELLKKLDCDGVEEFVTQLGISGWNLGYVRNYALIVSKILSKHGAKILFIDDDIIIREPESIRQVFSRIDSYDFVGTHVVGMEDDAVVGHLMRACGEKPYEFLCGGFLAFDINTVSEYFLNCYNEDQIWLFLHQYKTRFEMFGEVEQQQYNPFENAEVRALNQEFGEILQEGADEAFRRENHNLLLDTSFWQQMCTERLDYLNLIPKLVAGSRFADVGQSIYATLIDYHSTVSVQSFAGVFRTYFAKRECWRKILKSI